MKVISYKVMVILMVIFGIVVSLKRSPVFASANLIPLLETATPDPTNLTRCRALTNFTDGTDFPTLSPNGKQIAFTVKQNIYIMDADGSNQHNLTQGDGQQSYPVWSPDGQQIAFIATHPAPFTEAHLPVRALTQLEVINADGSNRRPLVSVGIATNQVLAKAPVWWPDGKHIGFQWQVVDYVTADSVTQLVDVENGNRVNLPGADLPVWALDGKHFAIFGDGLEVSNANGSHPVHLFGGRVTALVWSPNSQQLAFIGHENDRVALYVIDSTGNNLHRFDDNAVLPVWSPDGQQIAFRSFQDWYEVHIINVDGSNPRRLTYTHSNSGQQSLWLPDGKQIAFLRGQIYVVNLDNPCQVP